MSYTYTNERSVNLIENFQVYIKQTDKIRVSLIIELRMTNIFVLLRIIQTCFNINGLQK